MTRDEMRQVEVEQFDPELEERDTLSRNTRSVLDLPLHRRFRLWLPLLGALPALALFFMFPAYLDAKQELHELLVYPNLTVLLLDRALVALFPAVWSPICSAALLLGAWYVVGLGLDSLRADKAHGRSRTPGWAFVLTLLAFAEFIRITALAPEVFRTYLRWLQMFGIELRSVPMLVRINYRVITHGAPLVWVGTWALVLDQLGRLIRAQRQRASMAGFPASSLSEQPVGFHKASKYSHLPRVAVALLAIAAFGPIVLESTSMWREARDLLRWVCSLPFALTYVKWLFPEFSFRRALRQQIGWAKLRGHLTFLGVGLATSIALLLAAGYFQGQASRLPGPTSMLWQVACGVVFSAALLFALFLVFRLCYARHLRDPRRHFVFAGIALTMLRSSQLATAHFRDLASREYADPYSIHAANNAQVVIASALPLQLFVCFVVLYRDWLFPDFRLDFFRTKAAGGFVSWNPRRYSTFAIVLLALICTLLQDRGLFWKALVDGSLLLLLNKIVPRNSRYRWMFYGGVVAGLVLMAVGSYNPERDLFLALIGFVVSYGYWLVAEKQGWKHPQSMSAAILFLTIWVLCSVGDALPPDMTFATAHATIPREYSPERFAELKQQYPGRRVGLALSGGGFRAALMHAGVLQGFEETKIPITNISAVSGGSITGAYYSLGGTPQGVLNAILFRQFNTPRDFFDIQNAARMIFSAPFPGTHVRMLPGYSFGRTNVQAQALDRVLLHGRKFRDLPGGAPRLMICVTDLNSGSALGLTSGWRISRFLLRPPGEDLFPNVRALYGDHPRVSLASSFAPLNVDDTNLSKAVAASGAFPLAFEPVLLSDQRAGNFLMADGGVSDNSGMTLLLEADRRASLEGAQGDKDWALDIAISVDGGAMFQRNSADADTTSVDVAERAVDLIHSRLGATRPSEARGPGHASGPSMILLSPALYMDNSRNYDYKRIAFDVEPDSYPSRDVLRSKDVLFIQQFSEEQQQLLRLLVSQVTNMDHESLELLRRLRPQFYGDILDTLNASWLTEEEGRILKEGVADQTKIDAINAKRRRRANALLWMILRVDWDFSQCLHAFVKTPTLDDNISAIDAERLFRLGEYLALLNAREVREGLKNRAATTSDAGFTPAERAFVFCAAEAAGNYSQSAYKSRDDYRQHRRAANTAVNSCMLQLVNQNPSLRADVGRIGFTF